jgi:hypothetical protein
MWRGVVWPHAGGKDCWARHVMTSGHSYVKRACRLLNHFHIRSRRRYVSVSSTITFKHPRDVRSCRGPRTRKDLFGAAIHGRGAKAHTLGNRCFPLDEGDGMGWMFDDESHLQCHTVRLTKVSRSMEGRCTRWTGRVPPENDRFHSGTPAS